MAQRFAAQVASSEPPPRDAEPMENGVLLALAYPDRIARGRGNGAFTLVNGRGASVDAASSLAREPFLAVAEIAGTAAAGRILLAAPLKLADIEHHFADRIEANDDLTFDTTSRALRARRRRRLGAMVLAEQPLSVAPSAETAVVLAQGLADSGLDRLPWSKALTQWRDRVMFLRKAEGDEWPDLSDAALAARLDDWLVPALYDKTSAAAISAGDLSDAVMALMPYELRARLDREAPTHFEAPTGSMIAIEYEAPEGPKISVRVQEMFGLAQHPSIARGRVPLVVELLSPAHRPVQVTRDLPGFWSGSYAAVRADLRGRYPRHPWPDDPAHAAPTRRAKPRGT
jgi:ATP-dependent helicase HrpB